jgi:phosphoserine phosphatase
MKQPKLVAFDVDGTLVESADGRVVWQLLNASHGSAPEENRRRYQAFMSGEISYPEWVDLDIGSWQASGATRTQLAAAIRDGLFPAPGALETIRELKSRGYRLAVISGTLDLTLELLLPSHPFEAVFTNKIWFDEAGLIAGWRATPYDNAGKAEALERVAAEMGLTPADAVFVGDNINDLEVMARAGLAVAFNPKAPKVETAADHVLRADLRGLLKLLP